MNILYPIIVLILFVQWLVWLSGKHKELWIIRGNKRRVKTVYALMLLTAAVLGVAGITVGLAWVAASSTPEILWPVLITLLLIGLIFLLCLKVFLMDSRPTFKAVLYPSLTFSCFLLGIQLVCLFILQL